MVEYNFDNPEEFAEHIRMLKETNGSLKQLKEIKTYSEFYRAVNEELSFFKINLGDLEKYLYIERNIALGLSNRFKDGELSHLSLDELYDELELLVEHSKTVNYNHRVYSDITGETCEFYNQYERILGDVLECLDFEIKEKKMDGDYR